MANDNQFQFKNFLFRVLGRDKTSESELQESLNSALQAVSEANIENVTSAESTKSEGDQVMAQRASSYSMSFKDHQRLFDNYQAHEASYQKDLASYQEKKKQYVQALAAFRELAQKIADKKQSYSAEMADFQSEKAAYEAALKEYQTLEEQCATAKADKESSLKTFKLMKETLEKNQRELNALKAKGDVQSEKYQKVQKDYTDNSKKLEEEQKGLASLSAVYEMLEKSFKEKEVIFKQADEKYGYAKWTKEEWDRLNKSYKETEKSKELAQNYLDEAKSKLEVASRQAKIQEENYQFVRPSFSTVEGTYKSHQQKFEQISTSYEAEKEKYDQEFDRYSELKNALQMLQESKRPSKIILDFTSNSLQEAKAKVDEENKVYEPIRNEFDMNREMFQQIDQNYQALKKIADESRAKHEAAAKKLATAQRAQQKLLEALEILDSKYDLLKYQQGQAEENFRKVEPEFETNQKTYEESKAAYDKVKDDYEPAKEKFDQIKEAYESTKTALEKKEKELAETKTAYQELNEQIEKASKEVEENEKVCNTTKLKADKAENDLQKLSEEADKALQSMESTYQEGDESYASLLEQYNAWQEDYQSYNSQYKDVSAIYAEGYQQLDTVQQQYESLARDFETLNRSNQTISERYQEELAKYNEDKSYYDRVASVFQTTMDARRQALDSQKSFETAIINLKSFLRGESGSSFPILEATGNNYVDEYNIPETTEDSERLARRPELDAWNQQYQSLYRQAELIAAKFAQDLEVFQESLTQYLKIGGKAVADAGNSRIAYHGVDVTSLPKKVESSVAAWQAEYEGREQAFAKVVKVYKEYLSESEKLNADILKTPTYEKGIQVVIDKTNSLANFSDVYNKDYRDVKVLAAALNLKDTDLISPKNKAELTELVQKNYHDSINMLLNTSLQDFLAYFKEIRVDYDKSITDLQTQLNNFIKVTNISMRNIKVENLLTQSDEIQDYFQKALEANTEAAIAAIAEIPASSSLINCLKKVQNFTRVANDFLVDESDNTLSFPEKALPAFNVELDTSLVIAPVKGVGLPTQPEKPEIVDVELPAPDSLDELPSFVEDLIKPEKISKEHQSSKKEYTETDIKTDAEQHLRNVG